MKFLPLLLAALWITTASAHENCHHPSHLTEACNDHPDFLPENLRSFEAFVSGFHWGDRKEDVCDKAKGSYEYYSEPIYKQLFTGPETSRVIDGMPLRGTAEELSIFGEALGSRPPSKWKQLAAGCTHVVCALEKMTGSKDGAYRTLIVGKRDGYIMSFDQAGNPNQTLGDRNTPLVEHLWSDKDIRIIEQGMAKLPDSFRRLPTLRTIQRYPDGYRTGRFTENAAAMAQSSTWVNGASRPGRVVMFDSSLQTANTVKSQLYFIHEVFHHRDFSERARSGSEFGDKREFQGLSGWRSVDRTEVGQDGRQQRVRAYETREGHSFVRDYAKSSPSEDFAESGAHYILAPDSLQRIDPDKYAWFKDRVLGGQEFNGVKWPELDATVVMAGGWQEALQSCMRAPHSLDIKRDGTQVNWASEKKDGSYFFYPDSPGNLLPLCLTSFARNLVAENPFLCAQLNGDEILHYLSLKVMPEVNAVESVMESGALGKVRDTCVAKGDQTPECVAAGLKSLVTSIPVSRTGAASDNLGSLFNILGERVTGKAGNATLEALRAVETKAPPSDAYSRCIMHRAQGGGGPNLFELRTFSSPSGSNEPFPGCREESFRYAEGKGVKFGSSGDLKERWFQKISQENSHFEQAVVLAYIRRASSECKGNAVCKTEFAARLMSDWIANKPVSPEVRAALIELARKSAR